MVDKVTESKRAMKASQQKLKLSDCIASRPFDQFMDALTNSRELKDGLVEAQMAL